MSPPEHARLLVLKDGQTLREVWIEDAHEILVGRSPQCRLVVPDGSVSRMHARIYTDSTGAFLEDLGSVNGTTVDGRKVEGVVRLTEGNMIRFGQRATKSPYVLRYTEHRPAAATVQVRIPALDRDGATEHATTEERVILSDAEAGSLDTAPIPIPVRGERLTPPERELPTVPPKTDSPSGDVSIPEPSAPIPSPDPVAATANRFDPRLLGLLAGLLVVIVGLAAAIALMLRSDPGPSPWDGARLGESVVGPGHPITIVGLASGIEYPVEITLDATVLEDAEIAGGELTVPVPDLHLTPGDHERWLTVTAEDLQLFAAPVTYRSPPELGALEPPAAPPGAVVTLRGRGLDMSGEPTVTVAGVPATVLSSDEASVVFRVPPNPAGEARITVSTGRLELEAPTTLTVNGVDLVAIPLELSAEPFDSRSWQLSTPWGPAFTVDAPPQTDPSEPFPEEIVDRLATWDEIFGVASVDSALQIESESVRGGVRLSAVSPTEPSPIELALLPSSSLRALAGKADTTSDLHAAWQATAWNGFLDLFGRGRVDDDLPEGSRLFAVFASLERHNRLAGGDGRPSRHDLDQLSPPELEILGRAFLDPAPSYVSLAGRWTVELDDVFSRDSSVHVTIDVTVRQRGHELTGDATPNVREGTVDFEVAASDVRGRVQPGSPPGIELDVTFDRPVGRLRLEGSSLPTGLAGTFTSSMGEGVGHWTATRVGQPAIR